MERNPDNEIAQIEQSLEEFLEREMGGFPENQPISGWQEEADRPYNKETPPKQRKPQTNRRELQADMLAPQYRQNASSGARETRPGSGAGKEAVSRREAVPAGAGAARNAAFRSRQPERPQRAASSSGHAPDRQEALGTAVRHWRKPRAEDRQEARLSSGKKPSPPQKREGRQNPLRQRKPPPRAVPGRGGSRSGKTGMRKITTVTKTMTSGKTIMRMTQKKTIAETLPQGEERKSAENRA